MKKIFAIIIALVCAINVFGQNGFFVKSIAKADSIFASGGAVCVADLFDKYHNKEEIIKIGECEFYYKHLVSFHVKGYKPSSRFVEGKDEKLNDGRIVRTTYYMMANENGAEICRAILLKKDAIRKKYGFTVTDCSIVVPKYTSANKKVEICTETYTDVYVAEIWLSIEYSELVPQYNAEQKAIEEAKKAKENAELNSILNL